MEMDVLVISMQGIGNSLLAVPMIKALKECFKNVHITVLVQKKWVRRTFKNLDFIDEIIIYNKADSVYEKIHLILTLRNKKFGSILLTYPSSRKNVLLAKLIGANKIIGHTNDSGKNCYRSKCNCTNKIPVNENLHDLEQNFNLLKPLGIQPPKFDTSIKIPLSKNAEENVDILLKKNNITPSDIIIGIHPGSSDGFKEKKMAKRKICQVN